MPANARSTRARSTSARARPSTSMTSRPTWLTAPTPSAIRVDDPAGNTASATRDFSVDTVGPVAEVTGPKSDRRPQAQLPGVLAGGGSQPHLQARRQAGRRVRAELRAGQEAQVRHAQVARNRARHPREPRTAADVPVQGPETAAGGRPRGTNRGHRAPPPQVRGAGDRQPRAELHPARPVQVLMPVLLGLPRIPA